MRRGFVAVVSVLLLAAPCLATTLQGKDAFSRGDFAYALKKLTPEAEKGDPEALFLLGRMYQGGMGVEKDVKKGVELLGKAAEKGDSNAQYYYGVARALGDGVEQDLVDGIKWMYIAVRMGNATAEQYLNRLRMPQEVFTSARKAAAQWHNEFEEKRLKRQQQQQ